MNAPETTSPGAMLRDWRSRRRMSQLDLALEAEISQRHLSFLESGRSRPSREMAMHLAERLDMPLRERNRLLLAAGFAPGFAERPLEDPSLGAALQAVDLVLKGHEPYPAIAVDRYWTMLRANGSVGPFLQGVADPALLKPPVNVLRLSLHPRGMAPNIVNLTEWRDHLLERLRRLNNDHADPRMEALEQELRSYPAPKRTRPHAAHDYQAIAVPIRLRHAEQVLSFISTITVFGTPLDVTVSELAVESFFPADEETAAILRGLDAARRRS